MLCGCGVAVWSRLLLEQIERRTRVDQHLHVRRLGAVAERPLVLERHDRVGKVARLPNSNHVTVAPSQSHVL